MKYVYHCVYVIVVYARVCKPIAFVSFICFDAIKEEMFKAVGGGGLSAVDPDLERSLWWRCGGGVRKAHGITG
jgi:hypothetical protein